MRPSRGALLLLGAALLGACLPTTQSSPSAEASASVSASAVGNLPPGCEPIELRAPSGERIDLNGTWLENAEGAPMTWRIKTEGNCIWGAGFVESIPYYDAADSGNIQTLRGHIGSDFAIDGEIVLLGPEVNFLRPPIFAPVQFLIEFGDAGQVILRENREPGVPGPRCVEPTMSCLRPLVLLLSEETI
jgi:hypothetical protein